MLLLESMVSASVCPSRHTPSMLVAETLAVSRFFGPGSWETLAARRRNMVTMCSIIAWRLSSFRGCSRWWVEAGRTQSQQATAAPAGCQPRAALCALCRLCASGRHRARADRSGQVVARFGRCFRRTAASGQEVRSVVARESWNHEFHGPDLSTAAQAAKKSAFDAENPFCCSHSRMAISVARQVSTVSGYSTPMVASRSRIVL